MTPYDVLVAATLRARRDAVRGAAAQDRSRSAARRRASASSRASFKYGLVHETLLELEVLLGDGSVVPATPDNEHRDLFFGFPNSYGTLGYALRVKAKDHSGQAFRAAHAHPPQRSRCVLSSAR